MMATGRRQMLPSPGSKAGRQPCNLSILKQEKSDFTCGCPLCSLMQAPRGKRGGGGVGGRRSRRATEASVLLLHVLLPLSQRLRLT